MDYLDNIILDTPDGPQKQKNDPKEMDQNDKISKDFKHHPTT